MPWRCRQRRHQPPCGETIEARRGESSRSNKRPERPTQISSTPSSTTAAEEAGRLPVVRAARHGTGLELLMEVEVELGHVVEALQCGERVVA